MYPNVRPIPVETSDILYLVATVGSPITISNVKDIVLGV